MCASPSIVHDPDDRDTYLVLNDFGRLGRAWPETDENRADRESVIQDLFDGHYFDPVRVVAFNVAEGWCRDVSKEIADELDRRLALEGEEVRPSLEGFLYRHVSDRPAQLPLPLRRSA